MVADSRAWRDGRFVEVLGHYDPRKDPAVVKIDAYPDHEFKAHVDSIQAGTGARFSMLPPENATGNYVKVVQRVPVKILFDANDANARDRPLLSLGMSVEEIRSLFLETCPAMFACA